MDPRWRQALRDSAREALPASVFDYIHQGARESLSADEAADAWRQYRLLPRTLRDVTEVDPAVEMLGRRSELPIGIAPTSLQRTVHPDGELAMARAAVGAGVPMVVSSNAGTSFEEIGHTGVDWWLQAYLPIDRSLAELMLARAVSAGARAVVLTVDTPVVGTKYVGDAPSVWSEVDPATVRVNFDAGYDDSPGSAKATDLGPADVTWLGEATGLPVVVKGLLHPDDARVAVDAGASAVWVSNHGGRQLDRVVPTAHALPDVVAAVGARTEVYVDGGVRSGLDVLTALGLGASAVFLGRLPLYALVTGEDGVRRLLQELADEVSEGLRLGGCRSVPDAVGLTVRRPLISL